MGLSAVRCCFGILAQACKTSGSGGKHVTGLASAVEIELLLQMTLEVLRLSSQAVAHGVKIAIIVVDRYAAKLGAMRASLEIGDKRPAVSARGWKFGARSRGEDCQRCARGRNLRTIRSSGFLESGRVEKEG